jgi:hypothetical protein
MKSQRQLDERKEPLRDVAFQLLSRFPTARWAPIPLRLIVGYGFMEHGFAKLARGSDAFATILDAIGVPAPHFMAWSTILTEVIGGLAVILGAFVALPRGPCFGWFWTTGDRRSYQKAEECWAFINQAAAARRSYIRFQGSNSIKP